MKKEFIVQTKDTENDGYWMNVVDGEYYNIIDALLRITKEMHQDFNTDRSGRYNYRIINK